MKLPYQHIRILTAMAWLMTGATLPSVLAAGNDATQLQTAIEQVGRDIAQASAELADATERIAGKRAELVKEMRTLRRNIEDLQRQQSAPDRDPREALRKAEQEVHSLGATLTFVEETLRAHRRSFEMRTDVAGSLKAASELEKIDAALNASPKQLAVALQQATSVSLDFVSDQLGGDQFEATVSTARGERVHGQIAAFGPVVYFVGADETTAGPVAQRIGNYSPIVLDIFSKSQQSSLRRLHINETVVVPVDPSSGMAYRLEEAQETLWSHIKKGRAVMVPLLALGGTCVILALYKLWVLAFLVSGNAHGKIGDILAALREKHPDRALAIAASLHKPLAAVIAEGIRHRDAPKEHLEEIMYERLISQTPHLERLLSPLAVCASAAPLLGLLGTVTGMIHTFRLITVFGTGDPAVLSAGISEALVTTEMGLIIAVPALLVHAFLSRRVRRAVALTQQSALAFVNGLKLHGADRPEAA